jgi:hypothetical protein
MTPTCTCHPVNWFASAPHLEFIQTIGCQIHGDPDSVQPYAPKEAEESEKE